MITSAAMLLVYLWHYLVARLLYDDLLRPLLHGRAGPIVFAAAAVAIAFSLLHLRWRSRRPGS
jgi:hypothetical protein